MVDQKPIRFAVGPDDQGQRLDKFLSEKALGVSRSELQRWIEEGLVRIDAQPAQTKTRLNAGSWVEVWPKASPEPARAFAQNLPLEVVFEDEDVIVINKRAGMVVHPAPGHAEGTLVNALLHQRQLAPTSDPLRPGLVHRLDKETSGLLVIAKSDAAYSSLSAQFKARTIERLYLAIVVGHPPDKITYRTFHSRHPKDRKRFTSRSSEGRVAITHLQRIEQFAQAAWVKCRLETGRTHQIRVHCAEHGHAVLGDKTYGRPPRDPALKKIATQMGHHALHAQTLGFVHPSTGERLFFTARPPTTFVEALSLLGAHSAVFQELK